MSLKPPEARACALPAARVADLSTLYWVIGGCWGDESRAWRRWSEVCGPYVERAQAEALRRRMLQIHRDDPRVHFEVVRRDEDD